jgi:serine/threonine-protein kinase HipA
LLCDDHLPQDAVHVALTEDLQLPFAPGSSLGGARPKAPVREKDGQLAIRKFPRKDDETSTVVWEAVALTLAHKAGIPVPDARVEAVGKKPVLLLRGTASGVSRSSLP